MLIVSRASGTFFYFIVRITEHCNNSLFQPRYKIIIRYIMEYEIQAVMNILTQTHRMYPELIFKCQQCQRQTQKSMCISKLRCTSFPKGHVKGRIQSYDLTKCVWCKNSYRRAQCNGSSAFLTGQCVTARRGQAAICFRLTNVICSETWS